MYKVGERIECFDYGEARRLYIALTDRGYSVGYAGGKKLVINGVPKERRR